jgi:hypothetical protein
MKKIKEYLIYVEGEWHIARKGGPPTEWWYNARQDGAAICLVGKETVYFPVAKLDALINSILRKA